ASPGATGLVLHTSQPHLRVTIVDESHRVLRGVQPWLELVRKTPEGLRRIYWAPQDQHGDQRGVWGYEKPVDGSYTMDLPGPGLYALNAECNKHSCSARDE